MAEDNMTSDNWTERDYEALRIAENNKDDIPFDLKLERAYQALYADENPDDGYRYFGGPSDR